LGLLTSGSDQVGEPRDDDGGAAGTLEEGKHWEDHHDEEAVDWDTIARGVSEDSWGSSVKG
jgi:hypothetical protein